MLATFGVVTLVAASCGGQLSAELDLEAASQSKEAGDGLSRDSSAADVSSGDAAKPWACAPSGELTLDGKHTHSPTGESHFTSTCSGAAANGPEDVYSLHVPARTGIRIMASTAPGGTTPVFRLLTACDVAGENVFCTDAWPTKAGGAALFQGVVEPGSYFAIVDQALNGFPVSAYTLDVTKFDPAPNSSCSGSLPLTGTGNTTGDVLSAFDPASTCVDTDAGHLYYRLSVPPGRKWTCTVTPNGPWRPTIGLTEGAGCAAQACLEKAIASANGIPATITVQNFFTASSNREIVLSVSATDVTQAGSFSLSVVSESLVACAPGSSDGTPASPTTHCCGGAVVDNASVATCGTGSPTSCTPCTLPAHGSVSCNGAACVPSCDQATSVGWQNCNGSFADGCETNLTNDARNCGTCSTACPDVGAGSTAACVDRACTFACSLPYEKCAGQSACVNTTSNPAHCGGCGAACPSGGIGGTPTCTSGACDFTCAPPYLKCPGVAHCVDPRSDPSHCGGCGACAAKPGTTSSCVNSQCTYQCLPDYCPSDSANSDPSTGCVYGDKSAHCIGASGKCGFCPTWYSDYCNGRKSFDAGASRGCCGGGACYEPYPGKPSAPINE